MTEQYRQPSINNPLQIRSVSGAGLFNIVTDDGLTIITAGAPTLTLPDARTVPGIEIFIKSVSGGGTVDTVNGQLIDAALTFTFTVAQQILFVKSSGGQWRVIDDGSAGISTTLSAAITGQGAGNFVATNSTSWGNADGGSVDFTGPGGAGDTVLEINALAAGDTVLVNGGLTVVGDVGAPGQTHSITGGAGAAATDSGGGVDLIGGDGNTTGVGGAIVATGGVGGATGVGGALNFDGGAGGVTSGAGGAASMTGGAATDGSGGNVSTTGGAGGTTIGNVPGTASMTGGAAGAASGSAGGQVNITGGLGDDVAAGGAVVIIAGQAAAADGAGGAVSMTAGSNVFLADGTGGAASLTGGNGQGSTFVGGAINITAGTGATGAEGGTVSIFGGLSAASGETAGSAGAVIINAGNNSGTDRAGDVNFTAGTNISAGGEGGRVLINGGVSSGAIAAPIFQLIPGSASGSGVNGSVHINGSNNEDEAVFRLSATGTDGDDASYFVGESAPSGGGGVAAEVSSIFHRDSGGLGTTGELYLKTGAADTAWDLIQTGAGDTTLSQAITLETATNFAAANSTSWGNADNQSVDFTGPGGASDTILEINALAAGDTVVINGQLLMQGAAVGDAVASANDIVIGDGSATDFGMTFFAGAGRTVRWVVADSAGGSDMNFRWTLPGTLTMRIDNGDRTFWTTTAYEPSSGQSVDLGSTTQGWQDIFVDRAVLIAGAVQADAPAGADDLVIGDGSGSAGLTIFGDSAAGIARLDFTDTAATLVGEIQYTFSNNTITFSTNGAGRVKIDANGIRGQSNGVQDLGLTSVRWGNLWANIGFLGGAVAGEAVVEGPDLVIGSIEAANHGITIVTGTGNTGAVVFSDALASNRGELSYEHTFDRFRFRIAGTLEMYLNGAELRPVTTGGLSLGVDTVRWGDLFLDDAAYVAGASSGDAPTAADDLVIGDGSADFGLSIFTDTAGLGVLCFNDTALALTGFVAYDHNVPEMLFGIETNATLKLDATALFAASGVTIDVGNATDPFVSVFAGEQVYGVEPTGATVTVTTNARIMADATSVNVDVDLPDAAVGLDYQIIVVDATNGVDVTPQAADTINGNAAGTAVTLSVVGRYFITAETAVAWWLHGPLAEA